MARQIFTMASHWSETPIARVLGPMQEFIHKSASSGITLMAATVLALIIANSPLAESYNSLLHTYVGITAGSFQLKYSLQHWVNDGLMAIFFFLVGLEIKREVLAGELANLRAAMLPILAALGGVMVPAAIYTFFNLGKPGATGWAIPMATDIAFALGLLALLGNRIPFGLKVFLTAVAIVDDLIAVLVIALFYSGGINIIALLIGFGILTLLMLANLSGIRTLSLYAVLGVLVWLAFLQSGIHATIAGVLVAWTVPARTRIDSATFVERSEEILARIETHSGGPGLLVSNETQQHAIIELEEVCEDVQAPLQKMEHSLHFWVQFVIMPIFALANAGVAISASQLLGESASIPLGIMFGLVVGKPVGILLASYLAVRFGLASLPSNVDWQQMIGVGFLAGIGFTMSLFIATLGFGEGALLESAKMGILLASITAGFIGFFILRQHKAKPLETPDSA